MTYTVLARRYRATTFGQMVGQEPIAESLRAAIRSGRVAHAYLFTGTRGVGKTSMARILARALNAPATVEDCPQSDEADTFPDIEVQERMAQAIMRGEDLNVIEIDGASNNSVDQARQLIANAGLLPTGNAHHKIYIIDEVHMLTPAAFNALLKTMEEPPPHVKFILCTTEPHKVPATIQSRCQRFDFRNIPTARIAEHLHSVLDREQVQAEAEVVWQVARLANGSMRDGLGMLDRLIASSVETITSQRLEQIFGLPSQDLVVRLVDALAAADVGQSLHDSGELLDRGIAQEQLIDAIIERLRQLMLINACGADSNLVELSDDVRSAAAEQAEQFDVSALVHMIALCENLQRQGKSSSNPRALLDATMVRLALAEKMADVTALLAGIAPVTRAQKKKGERQSPHHTTRPHPAPTTTRDHPPPELSPAVLSRPTRESPPLEPKSASSDYAGPPLPTSSQSNTIEMATRNATNAAPQPTVKAIDPPDLQELWSAVLDKITHKPSLTWVRQLQLNRFKANVAQISVLPSHAALHNFAVQQRQRLADLFQDVLNRPVRIELVSCNESDNAEPNQTNSNSKLTPAVRVDQQTAMSLPLVRKVIEQFDATLVHARRREPE